MLILGLDPGLGTTGWGLISAEGNRLSHIANGQVRTDPKQALPARLLKLDEDDDVQTVWGNEKISDEELANFE